MRYFWNIIESLTFLHLWTTRQFLQKLNNIKAKIANLKVFKIMFCSKHVLAMCEFSREVKNRLWVIDQKSLSIDV